MKAMMIVVATAGSLMLAGQASAANAKAEALAKTSGCTMCHSIDAKIVGPAFKEVAAKYKGDKTAQAKLIAKVKAGGAGAWGEIPMPANSPKVKDKDIKTLVKWVLSLK
ncbi:MAG: c-type cytochrome [Methylophilaceae bacterium]|nr:c-type cytochrome [Methylophilaceae bacterium]